MNMKNIKKNATLMTPPERLALFIEEVFKTKKAFTLALGKHQTWAASYTGKGTSIIRSQFIIEKLSKFGLNYNWYLTGEGDMLLSKNNLEKRNGIDTLGKKNNEVEPADFNFSKTYYIRYFDMSVLANIGVEASIEDINSYPHTLIALTGREYDPRKHFAFKISGNSMSDMQIFDGWTVVIDVERQPRNGDAVLAVHNGTLICKCYEAPESGQNEHKFKLYTMNDGKHEYPIFEYSELRVIGVVITQLFHRY
jgi:phage repressor protein C with HTH and peptisase S24 domain